MDPLILGFQVDETVSKDPTSPIWDTHARQSRFRGRHQLRYHFGARLSRPRPPICQYRWQKSAGSSNQFRCPLHISARRTHHADTLIAQLQSDVYGTHPIPESLPATLPYGTASTAPYGHSATRAHLHASNQMHQLLTAEHQEVRDLFSASTDIIAFFEDVELLAQQRTSDWRQGIVSVEQQEMHCCCRTYSSTGTSLRSQPPHSETQGEHKCLHRPHSRFHLGLRTHLLLFTAWCARHHLGNGSAPLCDLFRRRGSGRLACECGHILHG
jgi:hypothetical protein